MLRPCLPIALLAGHKEALGNLQPLCTGCSGGSTPHPIAATSAKCTQLPLGFCRYHHTAPINSFFSLREGLAMLAELVSRADQAGGHQQCWWGLGEWWVPGGCRDLLCPPLCPQGLESSWERHRANCAQLCQGLRDLGLELFVKEEVGVGRAHHHGEGRVRTWLCVAGDGLG